MDICPICRARLNGSPLCRRCKTDLTQAQAVEQQARHLEARIMLCMAQENAAELPRLLRRARLLHRTPTLWALQAMSKPVSAEE